MKIAYTLTPKLAAQFKEPFGTLIEGTASETMAKLRELISKEKPPMLIAVGDVVSRNVFEYNNVAFSSNANELAAAFFRLTSINSNVFRYNKYFDPFTSDDDIIVKGENYDLSSYSTFNLSSWNSATGLEAGSSRNPILNARL